MRYKNRKRKFLELPAIYILKRKKTAPAGFCKMQFTLNIKNWGFHNVHAIWNVKTKKCIPTSSEQKKPAKLGFCNVIATYHVQVAETVLYKEFEYQDFRYVKTAEKRILQAKCNVKIEKTEICEVQAIWSCKTVICTSNVQCKIQKNDITTS